MRWRWAVGALGTVALVVAVLLLRDQVVPPTPQLATASPSPTATPEPGLVVRDPARAPRWRLYAPREPTTDGTASREHLLFTRVDGGKLHLTVQHRDTGQLMLEFPVALEDGPWSALLHDGLLLVMHGRPQVRLTVVDPATTEFRELTPPAGHTFRSQLATLGEEVLTLGWAQTAPPGQPQPSCVLAVRPRTSEARAVWCAQQGRLPAVLYPGIGEVTWPSLTGAPIGCLNWHRLRPGGEVELVTPDASLCGGRGLVEINGWQVTQRIEPGVSGPAIVAADGAHRMLLGVGNPAIACGRHVYWSSSSEGAVYRWLPGMYHRELAYRVASPGRHTVAAPRCIDGVLSVAILTTGSGPRLVELRSLNRP